MASIKLSALTKRVANAIAKSDGQIEWESLPEILKFGYTRHAEAAIYAILNIVELAPAEEKGDES